MTKFFLMTRGRTGSTAVLDELDKSQSVCAMQELFILRDFSKVAIQDVTDAYERLLPFDLWKQSCCWWARLVPAKHREVALASRYLREAEAWGRARGASSFGFKVLSHHFEQRPFLRALLQRRGYRVIYLTRNLARQVLSGMVAKQRGIYNTKKSFEDTRRYPIDADRFEELVKWEANCVETDCAKLEQIGFSFIVVSYEDLRANREAFYQQIFQFLDAPSEVPPAGSYKVMIKDLRDTIENYEAVAERAAKLGLQLDQ